jgi:hypothetical protein
MNPRELVDYIRSGPAELVLHEPLSFRSSPCDFDEFLQALASSETIRSVNCISHQELSITEDEWVLLIKTIGSISGIQRLVLNCEEGSRDFHPFQAVAAAVNKAQSLRKLHVVADCQAFPGDLSGLAALANALRQHTALEHFTWADSSWLDAKNRGPALDPVFQALLACPQLRRVLMITQCASADAVQNLLQSPTVISLYLELNPEHWLAVANEVRQGRNNIRVLGLSMLEGTSTTSEATKALKAIASAIHYDENVEVLVLQMEDAFTDEAGVALAGALMVNTTLNKVVLTDIMDSDEQARNKATFGAPAYEAFSAMLRVNTSLELELPPLDTAGGDQRVLDSHNQMRMEQRLNQAGRGLLVGSDQTTRAAWVDALQKLNCNNADDTPAFQVGCLYSLLRLNPAACMMLQ